MRAKTPFSLGPSNVGSVLTGYRELIREDSGLLVVASVHVDLAEDRDDDELVAILGGVLESSEALDAAAPPAPVLAAMHEAALKSGVYCSAAVIRLERDHATVARCGLAAMTKLGATEQDPLLAPETLTGVQAALLTNALGTRRFAEPVEVRSRESSGSCVITVGGAVAPRDHGTLETLAAAPELPAGRGGVAVVLDVSSGVDKPTLEGRSAMKALSFYLALCAAMAVVTPRGAPAEWPPESLVNLQALPKETSVGELRGMMREFAGALGVRCTHCHVGDDPNDLTSIDFPSDEKIEKRKAREMIRMVRRINEELLARVPERSDPPVVVTCQTCHHSLTRPAEIRDLLVGTFETEGAEATIARYQELRERYYGSDSYDFRHFMLANVAERVARQDPTGAIRLLEFNGTLHPASGQTFFTMAQIYRSIDDLDGTVRSLERALEAEPENEFYRGALQKARGQ